MRLGEARGKGRPAEGVQGGVVDSERRSGTAKVGGRSVNMFRVGWGLSLATIPWSGRGSLGGAGVA